MSANSIELLLEQQWSARLAVSFLKTVTVFEGQLYWRGSRMGSIKLHFFVLSHEQAQSGAVLDSLQEGEADVFESCDELADFLEQHPGSYFWVDRVEREAQAAKGVFLVKAQELMRALSDKYFCCPKTPPAVLLYASAIGAEFDEQDPRHLQLAQWYAHCWHAQPTQPSSRLLRADLLAQNTALDRR